MKEPDYLWRIIGRHSFVCYVVVRSAPSAEKIFNKVFKKGPIKVEYVSSNILT